MGVSFCRVFAKLGSDMKKPDATTVIPRDSFQEIVWPLPVTDLLFVGRQSEQALRKLNIRTIGDLARTDRVLLGTALGKQGDTLWRYANGLDKEPVLPYNAQREVKSVGNSMTFRRDLRGEEEIRSGIAALADSGWPPGSGRQISNARWSRWHQKPRNSSTSPGRFPSATAPISKRN